MIGNARRSWVVALIALGLALGATPLPDAHAVDQQWLFESCFAVDAHTEQGLWDDMPGAGANNESGLFWFQTNTSASERCIYGAPATVSAGSFPQLRVRPAVNDGAVLHVYILGLGGNGCTNPTDELARITTKATQDNSAFRVYTVALPAGIVERVCIQLSDDPVAIPSTRASALIDDIRIWNPFSGAIGWRETFTRSGS